MNCEARKNCGFFTWMQKHRGVGADSFCPVEPDNCMRLDTRIPQVKIGLPGPVTHTEMLIGFPQTKKADGLRTVFTNQER
jgi:hypothetical protein